jgi:hypothetical protein
MASSGLGTACRCRRDKMQINRRIGEFGVSQKNLDGAKIGPAFQHVGLQSNVSMCEERCAWRGMLEKAVHATRRLVHGVASRYEPIRQPYRILRPRGGLR